MAGNGEESTPETLDKIMRDTWNETMGEDQEEIPESDEHLTYSDDDDEKEPVVAQEDSSPEEESEEEPEEDADTPEEEPVSEQASEEDQEEVSATSAPEHWSKEDREMFGKLDEEAQEFLLRRHKQMEGDYTRKTQEHAEAVKVGRLVEEGMDPAVKADLRRIGVDNETYIRQMMQWHHMSMQDPAGFARNIVQQLRLDPAQVFGLKPGEEQEQEPLDPTSQRIAAVEQHLNQEQQQRYQRTVQETQNRVQAFAEEKDEQGNLLRPHFEQVRKVMAQFVRVDPNMPLQEAYEAAVFRDPELRTTLMQAQQPVEDRAIRTKKALRAKSANIKARQSSSVNQPKNDKPVSLQEAMKAAADEVGL
jgi:hypothetical protein